MKNQGVLTILLVIMINQVYSINHRYFNSKVRQLHSYKRVLNRFNHQIHHLVKRRNHFQKLVNVYARYRNSANHQLRHKYHSRARLIRTIHHLNRLINRLKKHRQYYIYRRGYFRYRHLYKRAMKKLRKCSGHKYHLIRHIRKQNAKKRAFFKRLAKRRSHIRRVVKKHFRRLRNKHSRLRTAYKKLLAKHSAKKVVKKEAKKVAKKEAEKVAKQTTSNKVFKK